MGVRIELTQLKKQKNDLKKRQVTNENENLFAFFVYVEKLINDKNVIPDSRIAFCYVVKIPCYGSLVCCMIQTVR